MLLAHGGREGEGENREGCLASISLQPWLNSSLHLPKRRTRNHTTPGKVIFPLAIKGWKMGVCAAGIFLHR